MGQRYFSLWIPFSLHLSLSLSYSSPSPSLLTMSTSSVCILNISIAQTAVSIDEWPERISTTFVDLWERPTPGIELRSSISTSQSIKRKKRFADYQERQIESLGHDPSKPTVGLARSENERLDGEEGTMECSEFPRSKL